MFGYDSNGSLVFAEYGDNHGEASDAINRGAREPAEQGTADPSSPRQGTSEHVRAMEYGTVEIGGKEYVADGPILTPGDPIRRGDTPARHSTSRFYHDLAPWVPDEIELWSSSGERDSIERQQNIAGGMPRGRMAPMDEYRLLHDGSHA